MTNLPVRFALLGIDDDVTTCECCGRTNLKCTVVLAILDADGNAEAEVHYGRDCGAKALGRGSMTDKRKQRRAADEVESEARRLILRAIEAELRKRRTAEEGWKPDAEVKDGRGRPWGKLFRLADGRTYLRFTYVVDTPEAAARLVPGTWSRLAESCFVGKERETA